MSGRPPQRGPMDRPVFEPGPSRGGPRTDTGPTRRADGGPPPGRGRPNGSPPPRRPVPRRTPSRRSGYRHAADDLSDRLPRHIREHLSEFPHVVATGIGPKRINGRRSDDVAIIVFVTEKQPESALPEDGIVPEELEIGGEAYPTDVVETGGGFRAMSAHPGSGSGTRSEYFRPMPGGVEVGRFTEPSSSTAKVEDLQGQTRILMTRHALGFERAYPEGEDVFSPTDADTPTYRVGEVIDSSDWSYGTKWNRSDAALVDVVDDRVSGEYLGFGNASGAGRPDVDRRCFQISATTGFAGGEILAEDVVASVSYDFGDLTFERLIVTDLPGGPGSSGAAVAQYDPRGDEGLQLIGMHIAGSAGAGLVVPWYSLEQEFDTQFTPV